MLLWYIIPSTAIPILAAILLTITWFTCRSAKTTAKSLTESLQIVALVSLTMVGVVVAAPLVSPGIIPKLTDMMEPEDAPIITDGELLTAAATLMGIAVFGSALGTLRSDNDMVKGVAYTLIPTITVQAAFMLGVMNIIFFPAVVWIPMTAVLLMLVVLAMIANKILSEGSE